MKNSIAADYATKFNRRNNRDEFTFVARNGSVLLVDEDGNETEITNPFAALMEWESTDDEGRYYGLPGIVL